MRVQSGFTIVEVLLAMFILISAIYVLSGLQIRSILRVLRDRDKIDRVFFVKKELYKELYATEKQKKPITTQIEDPEIKIVTESVSIAKKSGLEDVSEYIQVLRTKGQWKKNGRDNEILMISFIPVPQENEEKK